MAINLIVPLNCGAVDAVKTTIEGFAAKYKLCVLLQKLKKKNKKNNVEISWLNEKKYYIKYNGQEGNIDIPQELSTLALILTMEYLNRRSLCSTCKTCLEKGKCPKKLFVSK